MDHDRLFIKLIDAKDEVQANNPPSLPLNSGLRGTTAP